MSRRTATVRAGRAPTNKSAGSRPGVLVLYSEGEVLGTVYEGDPEMSIGRDADNLVFIEDEGLSRQHAVLKFPSRPKGTLRLRDLDSYNGTYLNGALIETERTVSFWDVIRCGNSVLMPVPNIAAFEDWPESASKPPLLGGPAIQDVLRAIEIVAPKQVGVLIAGESGTGKELVANLLHARSGRAGRFVVVNCAAIPESLFEAELFGAKKGSFTGADVDRVGLMQEAARGTFFLDEIGELPVSMQPKLLRALESREIRSVGSNRPVRLDVRFVAASNRDLAQQVEKEQFREDLYHRLCGANIYLPPLRERRYDIVLLADFFLKRISIPAEQGPLTMTADFVERLLLHQWPGNVRQLHQTIRKATIQVAIDGAEHLEASILDHCLTKAPLPEAQPSARTASQPDPPTDDPAKVEDPELVRLQRALTNNDGNVLHAAAELGLNRSKMYRLLKDYNLSAEDYRRKS